MKSPLKYLLILCLLACSTSAKTPASITGKVVGIKDGDTIEVLYEGRTEIIRLADIDCPEKKQAFGSRAKQLTAALCFGSIVTVKCNDKRDRYKRIVGTVFAGSLNVNEALLKAGLAWHFTRYSTSKHYAKLEQTARAERAGLWVDPNPVPPWEFRTSRKKTKVLVLE